MLPRPSAGMASTASRSKSPKAMEDLYTRVLRVKRQQILLELPDTRELLKDARLVKMFTSFEKSEMTSQDTPSERADKMVRALEFKGYDSYKTFLLVLRDYRPSLANKLTNAGDELLRMNSGEDGPGSSDNSGPSSLSKSDYSPAHTYHNNVSCYGNGPDEGEEEYDRIVEDAGVLHFNDRGPGPRDHISSIGVSTRDHLAEDLNHRETFVQFCRAMRVDNQLVRVCLRSLNPTGQLLQELNSEPDATIERLGVALNQIGKPHLFESVKKLNETY